MIHLGERSRFAKWGGAWIVAVAAGAVGCGKSGVECHPVRGQVVRNGQPIAEASVVFHPTSEVAGLTQRPVGTTDEQGVFRLTTIKSNDGAPAGGYKVTVELRAPRQVGEEVVRDGKNLLPARYAKPETTPLSVEVRPGDNDLPAFEISG